MKIVPQSNQNLAPIFDARKSFKEIEFELRLAIELNRLSFEEIAWRIFDGSISDIILEVK